jgi:DNA-directed RNA polymerase subunit beta'
VTGRAFLSEILPPGLDFAHVNRALKKKEISKLINAAFRKCGLKDTVMFADKLMYTGFSMAARGGISICMQDMLMPPQKHDILAAAEAEVKEIEAQYTSGLVTQGERYNKVVDIWGQAGDKVAKAMMEQLSHETVIDREGKEGQAGVLQLHLHDGRLRRPRFRRPDPPAGRHARPDGQAGRLDHRDPHHGELP